MRELIATGPLTYATRRLKAGDVFIPVSDRDANVLIALMKAKPAEQDRSDDIANLRLQYQTKFGKRPFMGWDADKLREKITEESSL